MANPFAMIEALEPEGRVTHMKRLIFCLVAMGVSHVGALTPPPSLRLAVDRGIVFRDSFLSCIDFMNREATGQNNFSLASPVIDLGNLTLQWFPTDQDFQIESLETRTYSADLPGGSTTVKFSLEEVDALLGLHQSPVPRAPDEAHPSILYSHSQHKGRGPKDQEYTDCGLAYSLAPLVSPFPRQTSPIKVEVTLTGTALGPSGSRTPIARTVVSWPIDVPAVRGTSKLSRVEIERVRQRKKVLKLKRERP